MGSPQGKLGGFIAPPLPLLNTQIWPNAAPPMARNGKACAFPSGAALAGGNFLPIPSPSSITPCSGGQRLRRAPLRSAPFGVTRLARGVDAEGVGTEGVSFAPAGRGSTACGASNRGLAIQWYNCIMAQLHA